MIGERIEQRRRVLGLSQAAVARGSGVPQQTLNGIVRRNPRSSPHLLALAQFLRTTPAYLTGRTDDPLADVPDTPFIAPDEQQLLECYRVMTPADRKAIIQIACSMAGRYAEPETFAACENDVGPTVHAPMQDFRHDGEGR